MYAIRSYYESLARHRAAAFASLLTALLLGHGSATQPFVLEGRYEELQRLVLAQDPTGPVTALDVLLFLDMARSPFVAIPSEDS